MSLENDCAAERSPCTVVCISIVSTVETKISLPLLWTPNQFKFLSAYIDVLFQIKINCCTIHT